MMDRRKFLGTLGGGALTLQEIASNTFSAPQAKSYDDRAKELDKKVSDFLDELDGTKYSNDIDKINGKIKEIEGEKSEMDKTPRTYSNDKTGELMKRIDENIRNGIDLQLKIAREDADFARKSLERISTPDSYVLYYGNIDIFIMSMNRQYGDILGEQLKQTLDLSKVNVPRFFTEVDKEGLVNPIARQAVLEPLYRKAEARYGVASGIAEIAKQKVGVRTLIEMYNSNRRILTR